MADGLHDQGAVPHHERDLPSRLSYSHGKLTELAAQRANRSLIIQRVPQSVRRGIDDEGYFVPDVVSIGPCHHRGAAHLAEMEAIKEAVAHELCTNHREDAVAAGRPAAAAAVPSTVEPFLNAVRDDPRVMEEARRCYADGLVTLGDNEFANMMVVDGCFLLAVAAILTEDYPREHASWTHGRMLRIMKDVLLFENQIPWVVVRALMALRPVDMDGFVDKILAYFDVAGAEAEPGRRTSTSTRAAGHEVQVQPPPVHLLDLVHQRHLGLRLAPEAAPPDAAAVQIAAASGGGSDHYQYCNYARPFAHFTSAVELAEAGIRIHGSRTCRVRDVRVRPARWYGAARIGRLALPQLALSWLPRCWLINMVALECATDRFDHSGVSSYLAILGSLISGEKDVQELREKRILFSTMSDRRTVDFFQGLLDPLPRQELYLRTLQDIVDLRATRSTRSGLHTLYYRNRKIILTVAPLFSLLVAIVGIILTNSIKHN